MVMNLSRRSLILGAGASLIAAPAIVRATSLMRVKAPKLELVTVQRDITLVTGSGAYSYLKPGEIFYLNRGFGYEPFIVTNNSDGLLHINPTTEERIT